VADIGFVVLIAAFFLLCVALVRVCDRIIGPDDFPTSVDAHVDRQEATA